MPCCGAADDTAAALLSSGLGCACAAWLRGASGLFGAAAVGSAEAGADAGSTAAAALLAVDTVAAEDDP